jgi:hypothetical protein
MIDSHKMFLESAFYINAVMIFTPDHTKVIIDELE